MALPLAYPEILDSASLSSVRKLLIRTVVKRLPALSRK